MRQTCSTPDLKIPASFTLKEYPWRNDGTLRIYVDENAQVCGELITSNPHSTESVPVNGIPKNLFGKSNDYLDQLKRTLDEQCYLTVQAGKIQILGRLNGGGVLTVLASAGMTVAGFGSLFFPVIGPVAGGALLSAGINGIVQGASTSEENWEDVGKQMLSGAVLGAVTGGFGAVGGAASAAINAASTSAKVAQVVVQAAACGTGGVIGTAASAATEAELEDDPEKKQKILDKKLSATNLVIGAVSGVVGSLGGSAGNAIFNEVAEEVTETAARVVIRAGVGGTASAASAATTKMISNAAEGKSLNDELFGTVAVSFGIGAISGAVSEGLAEPKKSKSSENGPEKEIELKKLPEQPQTKPISKSTEPTDLPDDVSSSTTKIPSNSISKNPAQPGKRSETQHPLAKKLQKENADPFKRLFRDGKKFVEKTAAQKPTSASHTASTDKSVPKIKAHINRNNLSGEKTEAARATPVTESLPREKINEPTVAATVVEPEIIQPTKNPSTSSFEKAAEIAKRNQELLSIADKVAELAQLPPSIQAEIKIHIKTNEFLTAFNVAKAQGMPDTKALAVAFLEIGQESLLDCVVSIIPGMKLLDFLALPGHMLKQTPIPELARARQEQIVESAYTLPVDDFGDRIFDRNMQSAITDLADGCDAVKQAAKDTIVVVAKQVEKDFVRLPHPDVDLDGIAENGAADAVVGLAKKAGNIIKEGLNVLGCDTLDIPYQPTDTQQKIAVATTETVKTEQVTVGPTPQTTNIPEYRSSIEQVQTQPPPGYEKFFRGSAEPQSHLYLGGEGRNIQLGFKNENGSGGYVDIDPIALSRYIGRWCTDLVHRDGHNTVMTAMESISKKLTEITQKQWSNVDECLQALQSLRYDIQLNNLARERLADTRAGFLGIWCKISDKVDDAAKAYYQDTIKELSRVISNIESQRPALQPAL